MTPTNTDTMALANQLVAVYGAITVLEQLDDLLADQVTDADDGTLRPLTDDEAQTVARDAVRVAVDTLRWLGVRHRLQDVPWVRELLRDAYTAEPTRRGTGEYCPADRQLIDTWAAHGVPDDRPTRDYIATELVFKLSHELQQHHALYAELDAKRLCFNPDHRTNERGES